jgi:hypothetical protein
MDEGRATHRGALLDRTGGVGSDKTLGYRRL